MDNNIALPDYHDLFILTCDRGTVFAIRYKCV
jgi:hypothetical protein